MVTSGEPLHSDYPTVPACAWYPCAWIPSLFLGPACSTVVFHTPQIYSCKLRQYIVLGLLAAAAQRRLLSWTWTTASITWPLQLSPTHQPCKSSPKPRDYGQRDERQWSLAAHGRRWTLCSVRVRHFAPRTLYRNLQKLACTVRCWPHPSLVCTRV